MSTTRSARLLLATILLAAIAVGATSPAGAASEPSSDLLLPWFEVDLGSSRTTLYAIGNSADEPVKVAIAVHTNWGIAVLQRTIALDAGEVRTVNLRDWVVAGQVPPPALVGVQLEHFQAALTGQPSPIDDKFYSLQSDPTDPDLAVGYVTFRVTSSPRNDSLWGDYFWVDPEQDFAEGELLVDIDRSSDCGALCDSHRLRFLEGGGFDGGTKLVVWSGRSHRPSTTADALTATELLSISAFHTEPGLRFDEREIAMLPVQLLDLRTLDLSEDFGWLDVFTDEEIYVGVRYSSERRYSVTLQTWCLREPPEPPRPPKEPEEASIRIEKSTNGDDADAAPGPTIDAGGSVTWEYVVTNTGDVPLSDVAVSDDQEGAIACPKSTLAAGESMTCSHSGTAPTGVTTVFEYANLGSVVGTPPTGAPVEDDDPSHYRVEGEPDVVFDPVIRVEKTTNGFQADAGRGPLLSLGQTVTWRYEVSNLGDEPLENIQLVDDLEGAVSCPRSTLAVGSSMTCTKTGTAVLGDYRNVAAVSARGATSGKAVDDDDPSGYHVEADPPPASIRLEKSTNGHDADVGPGPLLTEGDVVTWTYRVTNDGQAALSGVAVIDDQEGAISCPKSSLAVGESMTCSHFGSAVLGLYANLGTATGQPAGGGPTVSDTDPSHYHAEPPPTPSIRIEKSTNGHDADVGPGPLLTEGDAVTWTYRVTNDGEAALTGVTVSDDQEGAISCPKSALAVGESMTCAHSGTAVVGLYANLGTATGQPVGGGPTVRDTDPSHYHAEPPPEPCGACEGKVTRLTLRYLGAVPGAHVQVIAKRGPSTDTVFDGIVSPGGTFEVIGPASGNGGFAGTLGTEIRIRVGGVDNATMHTSCSSPIGPGLIAGDFEVLEGASSGGGPLCPL